MEYTNNSDIRANNRKRLINTLFREGSMTKQELAVKLGISLPTVTLLLKEFLAKGFVTTGEVLDSTGGRKPTRMEPVYNIKYAVGMELSVHEVRIAAIDLGGNIIAKDTHPYELENSSEYWKKINAALMDFISREIERPERLLEVGITLQIPVKEGTAMWTKCTTDKKRMNLEQASVCFEMPVKFQNSARMAAVAQVWALNIQEDFVFVSLGSVVGGGIVYNGILMGISVINGQFGNLLIYTKEGTRKMDDICTSRALCERAGLENLNTFFRELENGNSMCEEIWKDYLENVVIFFHNIHNIFGWKIVIGGSMSPYLKRYWQEIETRLEELYDFEAGYKSYIQLSSLGVYSAAVGAAMFPIDEYFESGYYDSSGNEIRLPSL